MKTKEIVVLDCGVEVRAEEQGIIFASHDLSREFAFGLKKDEVVDMIAYLTNYLSEMEVKPVIYPTASVPQLTPVEKAAASGVSAGYLMPPSAVPAKGRAIPQAAVSVHK